MDDKMTKEDLQTCERKVKFGEMWGIIYLLLQSKLYVNITAVWSPKRPNDIKITNTSLEKNFILKEPMCDFLNP